MIKHGSFIISLDFEMMWGVKDIHTPYDTYSNVNVKKVREVISRMLNLFKQYNIHITFATVGLLMFDNKNEALKNIPEKKPSYINKQLSPYNNEYIENIDSDYAELYFAPDIIKQLQNYSYAEIATHTFSHYNCWAKGQTLDEFDADIKATIQTTKLKGLNSPLSIVFPRNNVSSEYIEICNLNGIKSYRGNPKHFYSKSNSKIKTLWQRCMRILDCYINVSGKSTFKYDTLTKVSSVLNIPSSRFLRPYNNTLRFLEPFKITRIKREIIHAARKGELYHLWWHPHNFGCNIEENLKNLESILQCYTECHKKYGMESYTMTEFYNTINNN